MTMRAGKGNPRPLKGACCRPAGNKKKPLQKKPPGGGGGGGEGGKAHVEIAGEHLDQTVSEGGTQGRT